MWTLGWVFASTYLALLGLLCIFGIHRLRLLQLSQKNDPQVSIFTPDRVPGITVQLPVYNEPGVIERLIDSVCQLDWPGDRIEIQILDDSDDRITTERAHHQAAMWRQRGVQIQVIQRDDRTGYKAGALAHGMTTARGDYIAIFDADFTPDPDFLKQVMPSFFQVDQARIGMVQARWGHLNRDQGLLTQLEALLLDGHFLLEHTARYRNQRFFNFNGTAGIWDRRCIEDAGGWEHDTITEDVDLSYRAQLRGWQFVYLPDVVAPAELPHTLSAYLTQQHRWTKGTIQAARKLLGRIMRSQNPLPVRIEAGFHLLGPMGYPLLLLLSLLLPLSMVARSSIGWHSALWLDLVTFGLTTGSVLLFYGTVLRQLGGPWRRRLWQVPAMMALCVGIAPTQTAAVFEGLFSQNTQFVRTPKSGGGNAILPSASAVTNRIWMCRLTAVLALYLLGALGWAIATLQWPSIPFLALFASGMSSVALASFKKDPLPVLQTVATAERDAAPAAK